MCQVKGKEIIDFIINRFGKLDILVNNAGISKVGLFMDSTKEDFDEVLDTNWSIEGYLIPTFVLVSFIVYSSINF